MADSTVRIQVDCQEMPPEQMAEVFQTKGKLGWFFFRERPGTEYSEEDLPEIKLEAGEKSPSQRLRNVLYRLWEQEHDRKSTADSFEVFYRDCMEKITNQIKDKLV